MLLSMPEAAANNPSVAAAAAVIADPAEPFRTAPAQVALPEPQESAPPANQEPIASLTVLLIVAALAGGAIYVTRALRLPRAAWPQERVTPPAAALWFLMLLLLPRLTVSGALALGAINLGDPAGPLMSPDQQLLTALLMGAIAAATQIAAIAAWPLATRRGRRSSPSGTHRTSLTRASIAGALGLALAYPFVLLGTNIAAILRALTTGESTDGLAHVSLRLLSEAENQALIIAFGLLVVTIVPAVEEFMYRRLVQGTLRDVGIAPWPSIVATSALFTTAHIGAVEPPALVGLLVLSLALGIVYERTRRLWAPILMHALFNALNFILLFLAF